jgi:hypothetical protein
MKKLFNNIKDDRTIIFASFINIFLIAVAIIYILFFYGKLPPLVPVFNQLPWGEQRLGDTLTIFIPIGASLLIFVINIFIGNFIYKSIPLISRMLVAISLLAGILTFILTLRTISLLT